MTALIIDTHPHVVSPDTDRYPLNPLGGKRSNWSTEAHSNTPEQLIAAMDGAGVAKAAVVHSSTTYGYDNSLVLDAVAQYPSRLAAVCSIDVLADNAVEVLKDITRLGCIGIRFFTTGTTMGQTTWLNDPKSYPVWEYATETKLPICVQVNPSGQHMLRDMMDRFPKVQVLLDHCGRADLSGGLPYENAQGVLEMASRYPTLVVKFTPSVVRDASKGKATPDTFLPLIAKAYGPERIMWGSNYPASHGSLSELIETCEAALSFLPQSGVEQIMGGNALRIYPSLKSIDRT